ncbi:twin-arginine translocation signal domain-containing protein [Puia sp. P3]|uniref:twin-arginine translocation signal domain-containing protein n=1 Tax=Puia sp. P3 TaxID=3423952 RepID=UPI003D66A852
MPQSRRSFLRNSAGVAALAALGRYPFTSRPPKTCGIQIGPDCFADEGTEKVLDILQEKGAVDTLYLSTFTYDRGIIGRTPAKTIPATASTLPTKAISTEATTPPRTQNSTPAQL